MNRPALQPRPRVADPRPELFQRERRRMIDAQLRGRGIIDQRVIEAMELIPRHMFVPEGLRARSYDDNPLPIGHGQTISQPYIVALMTQALGLRGTERVLEIGTGCGYQAALLAMLADRVFTIERNPELAARAAATLELLRLYNVNSWVRDGTYGWQEHAPYDGILVTAGAPEVPQTLVEQLKQGGRLVVPVGDEGSQDLLVVTRTAHGVMTANLGGCRFVKLIGRYGWKE